MGGIGDDGCFRSRSTEDAGPGQFVLGIVNRFAGQRLCLPVPSRVNSLRCEIRVDDDPSPKRRPAHPLHQNRSLTGPASSIERERKHPLSPHPHPSPASPFQGISPAQPPTMTRDTAVPQAWVSDFSVPRQGNCYQHEFLRRASKDHTSPKNRDSSLASGTLPLLLVRSGRLFPF
jgi:hypothetical protein